jgi:hypothetical protein
MVQTNKILTVSYGTFSCTLEGFDDSFGTMKAIAEYFRDLAADDRYFGAEPPQPDADMLARIAQREISRRVEAHREGNGFVLRAGDAGQTALAAPPAAPAPAPADTAPETSQDTPAEETAAVPEAAARPEPAPREDDAAAREEPEHVDLDSLLNAAEGPDSDSAEDDVAEDIADDLAPVDLPKITAAEPSDSIAAKLQRIRAVVSRNETATPDYSEDEHAESFLGENAAEDEVGANDEADEIDTDDAEAPDMIASWTSDMDPAEIVHGTAPEISEAAEAESAARADELRQADETEEEDPLLAFLDAEEDEMDVADESAPQTAEAAQDEDDEDDSLFADIDEDEDEDDSLANFLADDEEDGDAAPAEPLRARVVKVKRSDFDAAVAGGRLEEVPREDEDAAAASSLSPDEEADLLRELAAVEAELSLDESETDDGADDDDYRDAVRRAGIETDDLGDDDAFGDDEMDAADADDMEADDEADAAEMALADDEDDDLRADFASSADTDTEIGRLMAETDTKMGDDESSQRRQEISHLRAAVAAKRADGDLGKDDAAPDARYRDDLASVVRPRRPAAAGERSQRPEAIKAAPLKLVAEQRVDEAARRAAEGPVRPRRVPVAVEAETVDTPEGQPGFAEFAARSGALELSELLEAAAAYLSFVEGMEEFSRPQLMTKVRLVEQDDFSREDGLRSFGQLLREGKIEKIKGGRFTVSDRIGFKPEKRAAS